MEEEQEFVACMEKLARKDRDARKSAAVAKKPAGRRMSLAFPIAARKKSVVPNNSLFDTILGRKTVRHSVNRKSRFTASQPSASSARPSPPESAISLAQPSPPPSPPLGDEGDDGKAMSRVPVDGQLTNLSTAIKEKRVLAPACAQLEPREKAQCRNGTPRERATGERTAGDRATGDRPTGGRVTRERKQCSHPRDRRTSEKAPSIGTLLTQAAHRSLQQDSMLAALRLARSRREKAVSAKLAAEEHARGCLSEAQAQLDELQVKRRGNDDRQFHSGLRTHVAVPYLDCRGLLA